MISDFLEQHLRPGFFYFIMKGFQVIITTALYISCQSYMAILVHRTKQVTEMCVSFFKSGLYML